MDACCLGDDGDQRTFWVFGARRGSLRDTQGFLHRRDKRERGRVSNLYGADVWRSGSLIPHFANIAKHVGLLAAARGS
jgi:hypothetical protein